MESFLKYVAQDILQKYGTDLSHVAVVFPNKRASLFLNEELMRQVGHPIWCPTYITISDLFRRHSNLQVADPIKLICDLHKTFIEVAEAGTRAGAATVVEMIDECAIEYGKEYSVTLDRPFVYIIFETTDKTPLFIGTLENLK